MSLKEDQKIGEAIENYLKGIKTGEEKLFEKAFHSDSVVINGNENDPEKSTVSISDFVKNIKKRHEEGVHTEEIPLGASTSYIGNVGNVRLDFKLIIGDLTLYGTDYFNLVKRDDQWKISQKIYYVTHTE